MSIWRSRAFSASQMFLLAILSVTHAKPQQRAPFTVMDDIAIARFGDIAVSPKRELVVVPTERASLKDGMLDESLRIYRATDIMDAIDRPDGNQTVGPVWTIQKHVVCAGGSSSPVSRLQWLPDGTGFAFLLRTDQYHHRLYLANIPSRELIPLSGADDDALGFDIRDASHYVFTVASHEAIAQLRSALNAPSQVGTGHFLEELAYPEQALHNIQRGDLWAARGGPASQVMDRDTGRPVELFSDGTDALALSPDGANLIALRAVEDVSMDWVKRYPPPFPESAYRLKPHHQDLSAAADGWSYVSEWVRIGLIDGRVTSLTNAPASHRAGWWEVYTRFPKWSQDGSSIMLPGTFRESPSANQATPCILVVRPKAGESDCVRPLKRQLTNGHEPGWETIDDIEFAKDTSDALLMRHINHADGRDDETTIYRRSSSGEWSVAGTGPSDDGALRIRVEESFNKPPMLVATDNVRHNSQVILDPNPQLRGLAFGKAEPYSWRDKTGRQWQGILYKPVGYSPKVKYPLVIQNHGFSLDHFVPSGGFPSAFVAEELASVGIMVLHVRDCSIGSTPREGPCNVEGYESAVANLSKDGLVDPSRVGIIGFSRTVYYVLEALTTSKFHFGAASITDGIAFSYTDYLESVGPDQTFVNEAEEVIGSRPFGVGLSRWLKSSPVFNLGKVTTPLRVVAGRGSHVLDMWEPYALLEEMHKPVDLIVLNTEEHVITSPAIRLAAQGGNVDWFRFWLQGYEDDDIAKRGQYVRWEELRDEKGAMHH